jgi:hypothetical protein
LLPKKSGHLLDATISKDSRLRRLDVTAMAALLSHVQAVTVRNSL